MNNFDNKISDIKSAEKKRRIELGKLGLLIDQYPSEAREKLRKKLVNDEQRNRQLVSESHLQHNPPEVAQNKDVQ